MKRLTADESKSLVSFVNHLVSNYSGCVNGSELKYWLESVERHLPEIKSKAPLCFKNQKEDLEYAIQRLEERMNNCDFEARDAYHLMLKMNARKLQVVK